MSHCGSRSNEPFTNYFSKCTASLKSREKARQGLYGARTKYTQRISAAQWCIRTVSRAASIIGSQPDAPPPSRASRAPRIRRAQYTCIRESPLPASRDAARMGCGYDRVASITATASLKIRLSAFSQRHSKSKSSAHMSAS